MPWKHAPNQKILDKPSLMACSGSANQQESTNSQHQLGSPAKSAYSVETRIRPAKDGIAVSLRLVDSTKQRDMDPARTGLRPVGWISPTAWDSCSRDSSGVKYVVDLPDSPKEKEVLGNSRTWVQPSPPLLNPQRVPTPVPSASALNHNRPTCGRTVRFVEQPCTPRSRRKHELGSKATECRYRESYIKAQQSPVSEEDKQEQLKSKENVMTDSSRTFCRPKHKDSKEVPQTQTVGTNPTWESKDVPDKSWDLTSKNERAITCLTPVVVGTSEKCHVVIQGQPTEGCRDSYLDMIPKLHVVQGKKTTTFGLVSPKLNRRRPPKQDVSQDNKTLCPLDNGPRLNTPTLSSQSSQTNIVKMKQHKPREPLMSPSIPEMSLLQSGITCLTGGRDRSNRAVVEVYGDHHHWRSPLLSSLDVSVLMLYFHTITRKEVRELGITVVFDARKTPPHPKFCEALRIVQEQEPNAVHCVLLLMTKEKSYGPEKYSGGMEVVTSLKTLYKCVECSQLTSALGGSFPYRHKDWLDLHQELHPFVLDLKEATNLLSEAIKKLEGVHKIDTVQDVQQCIDKQRSLMKEVLEDTRLVTLQREGGAMLARLRWESDVRAARCKESREVMDTVEDLYNQVEEQVHVLARRSNMSLQHLNVLLQLRELESKFAKIKEWFDVEGERRLLEAESVEESSERIQETLQSFTNFLSKANEQKLQAMMLVTEAESIQGPNYPETQVFHTMVSTFKSSLFDFLSRAEQCCEELAMMVHLCHFCERATEVAEDCSQQLELERLQSLTQQERQDSLWQCHEMLSEFTPKHFQEVKVLACSLTSTRGMQVWNVAWLRCQEVWQQLEESLEVLKETQQSLEPSSPPYELHINRGSVASSEVSTDGLPVVLQSMSHRNSLEPTHSEVELRDRDSIYGTVTCFNINFRQSRKDRKGSRAALSLDQLPANYAKNLSRKNHRQKTIVGSGTVGCQWFPWQNTSGKHVRDDCGSTSNSSGTPTQPSTCVRSLTTAPICSEPVLPIPTGSGSLTLVPTCSVTQTPVPANSEPICHRKQPFQKTLQISQHFSQSHPGSFCPETMCCGTEISGSTSHSEDTLGVTALTNSSTTSNTMKLQHVMNELLLTEMEYVRSLGYILTHYLPLLARPDVPPDLRGQRGRIFGNLEKLHDFHLHYFHPELEACRAEPLMVGQCFLRNRENFGLYALYSKNKPQSDALIQQHKFFKRKQVELGDSMDLSSYLLKPVQRVSKYSLLLQEMLGELGPTQETERLEIQAAAEVVRFQLRHGNDLLTMDAIQDCDVNLKEQGELIRQDQFYIIFRKKRSLRRVFLFQDIILFTKTKKTLRGDEVYVYKQSFKTCDVGLTQNYGESGLCFEIWFRRRRAQDTYTLQAERQEVKQAWTADLEQILWEQALKNRALRRQERVLMGVGSKLFVDIQSSEGAIHNRTITYLLPQTETERLSSLVSNLQRNTALQRPQSVGSGSQSSSSSGRGSLSPSGFLGNQVHCMSHGIYLPQETLSGDGLHNEAHLIEDCSDCTQDCVCMCNGSDNDSGERFASQTPGCTSPNTAASRQALACGLPNSLPVLFRVRKHSTSHYPHFSKGMHTTPLTQ